MNPGLLDQRITLQSKSVTRAADGGEVISWTDVATVWARTVAISGRELIALRQADSQITTRFTIRHKASVTPVNRVLWKGAPYSITEVLPVPAGRPAYLELLGFADASP